MPSNIIAFAARRSETRRPLRQPMQARDNVVSLANWINRAIPHRTPNGVYFTTRVLLTTGDFA